MAWVMSVLGALLALGGAVSLWNGSGYIRMDWGQAETVAGTVALSAGVVALGLGAVLFRMRDIARVAARATAPAIPAPAMDAPDAPAPVRVASAPPAALPKPARIEPAPAVPPRPADLDTDLDEPFAASHSLHDPAPQPAAAREVARAAPEPPRPAPIMAEAPTVVGRYEANGASYVLFSDGTIEVETADGTHRFESMAHLKDHIERQDAG